MLAYIIMIGIPTILAILFSIFKSRYRFKNENKIILDSFFIIWLILLLFRSERIGVDLPVYKFHFNNYSLLSWNEILSGIITGEFEMGYVIISKVVSIFTNDYHWVIGICALVSVIPIWWLYRNEGKRHGYLIVVLFLNIAPFTIYFSGLRQALAMALVVPCYYYCKNKKIVQFLIMVFIAYLIHRSAFVLVIMYPLYHLRIKKIWNLLYIIPAVGITYISSMPIFSILVNIIGGEYAKEYASGIKRTGARSVLILLIAFLIYSYVLADSKKLDNDTIGLRNILILCVFIQVFAGVHTIAMRMNYYYLLLIPLLISRIIDKGKNDYRLVMKISLGCMVCFFSVYFLYNMHTGSDILEIYPYISVFSEG